MGDHLVGVGIGRRARASLKNVEDELVVEHTWGSGDLLGGLCNGVCLVGVEQTKVTVRDCRSVLDGAQCPDETAIEALAADRKVLDGALRGSAVIRAFWDLQATHRVVFDTAWRHGA